MQRSFAQRFQIFGFKSFFSSEINPLANAIRFESQNRLWSHKELTQHTNAVAYGLIELGFKKGDKLLIWLDKSHTSEIIATQIGCLKAGVIMCPITSTNLSDLEVALKKTQAKGLIFSPNTPVANQKKKSDLLLGTIIPLDLQDGYPLNNKEYPHLSHIIHTGFYSLPGTIKYREFLYYRTKSYSTLSLPKVEESDGIYNHVDAEKTISVGELKKKAGEIHKKLDIKKGDSITIIGNITSESSLACGVLINQGYGNLINYAGGDNNREICKYLKQKESRHLVIDEDDVVNDVNLQKEISAAQTITNVAILSKGKLDKSNAEGSLNIKGKNIEVVASLQQY